MNKSESITALTKALNTFQGKLTSVKKDAVNPFYKSKYATLDTIWETIRKPLSENGLAVTQTMGIQDGKSILETTLYHTSGEWISGIQLVNPVKDDPQALGSAISYARRYSLSAILGIVSDEDDDGNVATKPVVKPEPKTEQKQIEVPQKTEVKLASEAQVKKIYATVKEKGITPEQAKNYIKSVFNKVSTKELTISEASQLITDLNSDKLKSKSTLEVAKDLGAVEE